MPIKSPKQKGSSGEYEIISLLTEWGGEAGVNLTLERNLEQVRHGGADVNGVFGLEIEVKRVESNSIKSWWAQVDKAADRSGKTPMLAHRRNRQPWRFRVRTYVAVFGTSNSGSALLDIDLDLEQAKIWFIHYLNMHRNKL